jgi:conjugal transfer/entry exclusion protein
LRGVEGIDPAQLQNLLRNLAQLDDERTYQNASELLRLQTAVAEQLKRIKEILQQAAKDIESV